MLCDDDGIVDEHDDHAHDVGDDDSIDDNDDGVDDQCI